MEVKDIHSGNMLKSNNKDVTAMWKANEERYQVISDDIPEELTEKEAEIRANLENEYAEKYHAMLAEKDAQIKKLTKAMEALQKPKE